MCATSICPLRSDDLPVPNSWLNGAELRLHEPLEHLESGELTLEPLRASIVNGGKRRLQDWSSFGLQFFVLPFPCFVLMFFIQSVFFKSNHRTKSCSNSRQTHKLLKVKTKQAPKTMRNFPRAMWHPTLPIRPPPNPNYSRWQAGGYFHQTHEKAWSA